MADYVELHARSAFSFLRGASDPEALAEAAASAGLAGLALLDRDGVYGAPRLHQAARARGQRALVGAEVTLADGSVRFVSENINLTSWQRLGDRADGNVIGEF